MVRRAGRRGFCWWFGWWNVDCEPAACKHELEVWHDTWDWEDEDAEG